MKAFISASIILTVMIVLIVINSFILIDHLDALIPLCEAAKSSPAVIESIDSTWQNCKDFISFSVYRDELERVERALICAKSFCRTSEPDYLASIDELRAALEHIREAQEFSFYNIF